MSLNYALMLGSVVEEPQIKAFKGSYLVVFKIAISTSPDEPTEYVEIEKWQKSDKVYFGYNDQISVEGSLTTSSYENKKGEKVWRTRVKAHRVHRIDKS